MKIKHELYGEEDGVKHLYPHTNVWEKEGRRFYAMDGWSEVPEKQWVEVPPIMEVGKISSAGHTVLGLQRVKCVERYDLPNNLYRTWCDYKGNAMFWEWIEQFKKPCLIVEEYKETHENSEKK